MSQYEGTNDEDFWFEIAKSQQEENALEKFESRLERAKVRHAARWKRIESELYGTARRPKKLQG